MKQGLTSDAEMLAEAAMLREHRNRLENRMVTRSSSSWSSDLRKAKNPKIPKSIFFIVLGHPLGASYLKLEFF